MENIKDQVTSIKTIVNDHTKDINKVNLKKKKKKQ